MKKFTLAFALFISTISMSYGQTDSEYSATLKKMFKVSGTEQTYQAAITQMFSIFKQQYTDVPADMWEELEQEFSTTTIDDLTEMLIPVYEKHITIEDLKAIILFYQSPVGKKFAKKTPLITQESMKVGQEWGMKIGQEFVKKMEEKGY